MAARRRLGIRWDDRPKDPICEYCGSADVEVAVSSRIGWALVCNGCTKCFSIKRGLAEAIEVAEEEAEA